MNTTRRSFVRGLGGFAATSALAGCTGFNLGTSAFRGERLKFGVIGAGGKGFTDWTKFLANGEIPTAISRSTSRRTRRRGRRRSASRRRTEVRSSRGAP